MELQDRRGAKLDQESLLKKWDKTRALLNERNKIEDDIDEIDLKLDERNDRKSGLLGDVWKSILSKRVSNAQQEIQDRLSMDRGKYQELVVTSATIEKVRKSLEAGTCDTCGQDLEQAASTKLEKLLSSAPSEDDLEKLYASIQALETRAKALSRSNYSSNIEVLNEVQDSIDELRIKRSTLADRLTDIKKQTRGLKADEMRKAQAKHDQIVADISLLEQGVRDQAEALEKHGALIQKVEAEIEKYADSDLATERNRKQTCEQLQSLFAAAVDNFRESLKTRVEADASDLFVRLTSEPDYSGLRINDSYGLTILHKDGSLIPIRSAGAEHIVALCLMGALQRNAPLRGPIVMDSPFGRGLPPLSGPPLKLEFGAV